MTDIIQNNNPDAVSAIRAAESASHAAENARIAADSAQKLATATAVMATDISWVKKSLTNIEESLKGMAGIYVTTIQHSELTKVVDNLESRTCGLETNNPRTTVMLSIGIGILTLLTSILVYHVVGAK